MGKSLTKRTGQAALEQIGQRLWGFKPNLMADIVDQHGGVSALTWFARHMPTYERILRDWGPIRTHLVSSVASALTGCRYCTYGHAYALELHYFEQYDKLMPADEHEIVSWCDLEDDAVLFNFRELLLAADLKSEVQTLERLQELRTGTPASDADDDQRCAHLIKMFDYLNVCGIEACTVPDEAHDPINKNKTLRETYAELRKNND